ncbi:hypothetical protein C7C46_20920 [Streptomyces tateyamensis]|uniref:Uncharacterized protein n=2 Tax=Streptomyces tateyamensis TaxID=565073 RepID=A0A2V4NM17_9ACTN|nr:hypothetical protein C7C46_20920 [Streptomyces tateyamensis]
MLRWLSGEGSCKNGTCPTLWGTEDGHYVVQGYGITDPARLAELNLSVGETAVEIPAEVLESYFRTRLEAYLSAQG